MVITLLTDFADYYVGAMRGVISSKTDCKIIDIYNRVPRHNIRSGAFILANTAPFFSSGTIHCVVIDPGVGTERKVLVIESGDHFFVGPDNGVLLPAAKKVGNPDIYKIVDIESESNTFHGRDIFAPLAAQIAEGDRNYRSNKTNNYKPLNFGNPAFFEDKVEGEIIYIDNFGNIITNIDGKKLLEYTDFGSDIIFRGNKIPLVRTYGEVKKDSILSTIGSHGNLEISINKGSANEKFQTEDGKKIEINLI